MPVTWNFLDAFRIAIDRKDKDRERIEQYLDELADTADAMVLAWKTAKADIDKSEEQMRLNAVVDRFLIELLVSTPNPSPHKIINNAYLNSTSVVGGRMDSQFHDALKHALAVLLQRRQMSIEVYNNLLEALRLEYFAISRRRNF